MILKNLQPIAIDAMLTTEQAHAGLPSAMGLNCAQIAFNGVCLVAALNTSDGDRQQSFEEAETSLIAGHRYITALRELIATGTPEQVDLHLAWLEQQTARELAETRREIREMARGQDLDDAEACAGMDAAHAQAEFVAQNGVQREEGA